MSDGEARSRALEMARRQLSKGRFEDKERAAAERRQREFVANLTEFATAWNALIQKSAKGVWNAKQAKAVRKSFEKLVHSDGWVEDRSAEAALPLEAVRAEAEASDASPH